MATAEPVPIGGMMRGGRAEAEVALDPARLGPEAAPGLDTFSHVTVASSAESVQRVPSGRQAQAPARSA